MASSMTYIVALATNSGVPMFILNSRKESDNELPFAVVSALNAIHLFASNQDSDLQTCLSDTGAAVAWQVFNSSLTLIAVKDCGGCSELSTCHFRNLLTQVYHCLALTVPEDQLTDTCPNFDAIKKEFRLSYPLIHFLLEPPPHLLGFVQYGVDLSFRHSNQSTLNSTLDAFCEEANTVYGCLTVQGKIVAATEQWMSLDPSELSLLQILCYTRTRDMNASSFEQSVYLPVNSASIPLRCIVLRIAIDLRLVLLCNETHNLHRLEELVKVHWRAHSVLATLSPCDPVALSNWVLGVVVRTVSSRYCWSWFSNNDATLSRQLVSWCRRVRCGVFPCNCVTRTDHVPTETYECGPDMKSYTCRKGDLDIYIVCKEDTPTFLIRSLTNETLCKLTPQLKLSS